MSNNNLPPIWRFDFGDYSSLGSTFQKFLANINLFTLSVYNLLNGGIGFPNLQRVIYRTTFIGTSPATLSFVNPLPIAPSGVVLVKILENGGLNTAVGVSFANWVYDGVNINILDIPGLNVGFTYQVSLEVF